MRTTININAYLIGRMAGLNGIREKSPRVKLGLEALVCRAIPNENDGRRS
jgi:hypothetical protein